MSKQIIRALWGSTAKDSAHPILNRLNKVENDVKRILDTNLMPRDSFEVFVYGKANYKYLDDLGFKCRLMSGLDRLWLLDTQCYRHKLDVIDIALTLYDEIIYLDWDCYPIKNVDLDKIWVNNSDFSANLMVYNQRKCHWRTEHLRTVPNGGYMHVKQGVIRDVIKCWDTLDNKQNDEPAFARWLDNRHGNFNPEYYKEHYETPYSILDRKSAFNCQLTESTYFRHRLGRGV